MTQKGLDHMKEYRGFKQTSKTHWQKDNLGIDLTIAEDGTEVYSTTNKGKVSKVTFKSLESAINALVKEMPEDAVVSAIKEARERAGLSRVELERIVGIPHVTLQSWETNHRKCPDWVERLLIAEIERIGEAKKKLGV